MNFQQDIIKINDKKIFINPFLYLRKLDEKSKSWLREPGQISKKRIELNRSKFYPQVNWETLSLNEKLIKASTIELLLKTMDIIKVFHPNLNSEKLLEVERQLIHYKRISFEKWSKRYFIKKDKLLLKEKRKLEREDFVYIWKNWFFLKETQRLLIPVFVIILISALLGWFAGISKNSCNPYFESISNNQI